MIRTAADRSLGLQAIRGVAAFFVLLQHVFWLAGYFSSGPTDFINSLLLGGSGVFLFFGLSGYLMAGQMNRPVKRFLIDRVRRIYPGLILAFVVTGYALSLFSYSAWPKLTTVFLIPTGIADSIYIPYWTLIYEFQFYFLILLVGRFDPKYLMLVMKVWIAAIVLFHAVPPAMVTAASYPTLGEILFSFYNLYFIAGVFVWKISKLIPCALKELLLGVAILLIATLINVFTKYGAVIYYPLVIFAVFFAIRGATVWRPRYIFSKFFVRLGDVSYGVYLIHIAACFFVMLVVKEYLKVQLSYWQGVAALLVVGGGLAYLFGYLELRLQDKLKLIARPKPLVAVNSAIAE